MLSKRSYRHSYIMHYYKYLFLLFLPFCVVAQDFSKQWTGHFSYFKINDVYAEENMVYAVSDNSMFVYDTDNNASKVVSTVEGLSGELISAVYHSTAFDITLIGYENGLLELVIGNTVRTFVDIVDKPTIQPTAKRINHFFEYEDQVFIATGFGVVAFNLEKIEFGDTFFIGAGGSQVAVTSTAVLNDTLYASTRSIGLLSAPVASTNLVDFSQWTTVTTGVFNGLTVFDDQLLIWEGTDSIKRLEAGALTTVLTAPRTIKKIDSSSDHLTLTVAEGALVYDTSLQQTHTTLSTSEDAFIANAAVTLADNLYLATNTQGLLRIALDANTRESISPQGPLLNSVFRVEAQNGALWTVFGEYDIDYNPFPFSNRDRGVSKLTAEGWFHIPKEEVLGAAALSHITINPKNEDQVFISSFNHGLLEINDNEVTNLHTQGNSGFETLVPDSVIIFVNGSVFDKNGDLWIVNSRSDNGLKRFNTEDATTFDVDLSTVINAPVSNLGFSDAVLDRNGNVFFGSQKFGVIGYNPETRRLIRISGKGEGANLPSDNVIALEMDHNNQLWIGTFRGIRVLFNVSNVFQQTNPQTNQIIITDDEGVPQELLFDLTITDIEVDGANNKWVATASSGVFYLSADGRETLAHFTKANSPLPTNNVLDITVDDSTGVVYFATGLGMLSYKGTATGPKANLNNVFAFPNPVKPSFNGNVVIRGLTNNANVKITDIEGNLVHEVVSQGGSIQWDTRAFGRHEVASGVYLILVTAEDAVETTVTKLLIVR